MLISKFDLYKHEWLELVFENRNKVYGAYELRQHYASNMLKAMGITFLAVLLLSAAVIIFHADPVIVPIHPNEQVVPVIIMPQVVHPKAARAEPPRVLRAQHPAAGATMQHIPPIVVPDDQSKGQMKENKALTIDIGTVDSKGTAGGNNIPVETVDNGSATPVPDISVHTLSGLDVMPTPDGGEAAWNKFLSRNLRYPNEAQDAHVSGRVILSFIIEKDGHLSNIVVERPAGYGFDDEALRVLKMAKAWKPGMQNGQPVRVRYMIPINFQAAE